MKKPKKAAAQKAPQTDAEALLDIVEWSAGRPAWQRQALRLLEQQDELTAKDLDDLYSLAVAGGSASQPLTEADVRSPKSQTLEVTLKSVSKPQDVNALAPDQVLSFQKSGLTIVYGDNGAGKSGYARILKHACRARIDAKAPPILPNIYGQSAGPPRARIAYVANTQNKETAWQLDQPSPAELSAISVFDARTASVHVDGMNEVAYVPYSLDLMQRLAKAAEAIRSKSQQAKATIVAQTPQSLRAPPIDSATKIAVGIANLGAKTDIKALESAAKLSDQEAAMLAELRKDLAGDPAKTARQLLERSAGLARFSDTLRALCEASSAASLAELKLLEAAKRSTRAAADAAAQNRFAGDPLPNIGSDAWRALWEAARRYATMEALPDKPFPSPDAGDPCPLCQQPLSETAVDRLARFEAFVKDDTKQQADRAEKAYDENLAERATGLMPVSQLAMQLHYIADTLGDEGASIAARKVVVAARWQLRRILRQHAEEGMQVADIDPDPALQALQQLAGDLQKRSAALSADANSNERKALVAQFNELEARSWLATVLTDVKSEVERKKELAKLERVDGETDTKSITVKASQLAELLVTDALRAKFAKEIASLGVGELAVELKKESSQAGAARFRVRLTRKPTAAVGTVLSEGEHRCVALAAFLSELATSGSRSAIIFDDPVSSLDHRHRTEVANRLADEARHRQVIVLTHDVAFLMLLNQAAQDVQIQVGYRCISRGSDLAGYCSHDLPYNARPIDSVVEAIEADIKNKAVLWEKGRQAEWRNTVRGALEQLRETWERAVEEFIGPVFKRLSTKVDSKNLRKLTVLEAADCDAMREGFQACSELLHSAGESLNPKLPSPTELQAEIDKLRNWYVDLRNRQAKIKAA